MLTAQPVQTHIERAGAGSKSLPWCGTLCTYAHHAASQGLLLYDGEGRITYSRNLDADIALEGIAIARKYGAQTSRGVKGVHQQALTSSMLRAHAR